MTEGIFFKENMSDMLRLLVVYKYGGTYLDTDIISTRRIPKAPNFLTAQTRDDSNDHCINNCAIKFR